MKTLFKPHTILIVPMILAIFFGPTGCIENLPFPFGNDGVIPPDPADDKTDETTVEIYDGRIYLVGPFSGVLEDDLAECLTDLADFTGAENDGPVLVAGNMVTNLTEAQKTGLQATYRAKHPVALIEATKDQIDTFVEIVTGAAFDFAMPDNVTMVEVYAIDLEVGGDMHQWVQYPPQTLIAPDDADAQQSRANLLVEWLEMNGHRAATASSERAKLAPMTADHNDLTALATAYVDSTTIPVGKNNYVIHHFVYSCHAVNDNSDWLYVQQQCVLNSRGEYTSRKTWVAGWPRDEVGLYLSECDINMCVEGYENRSDKVRLIKASPETANEEVTIESGVEFEIGGQIGFGKEGGAASVSGGVTITNKQTVKVRDCKVINTSADHGHNAHWQYQFKKPTAIAYFYYAGITDPPDLAIYTFQPVNQWIWRLDPEVRAKTAVMKGTFECRLGRTRGVMDFIWVASPIHYDDNVYNLTYRVKLPYPPIPN